MADLNEPIFTTSLLYKNKSVNSTLTPVRVKDVILDTSHPEIVSKKFNGINGVGVIKYSDITQPVDTDNTETLPFAFPLNSFNLTLPLKNEVVLLVKGPREDETVANVDYYVSLVGLYNDVNYLESKNIDESPDSDTPGYGYKVNQKIRPLYPYNGDTIIQSRLGSSIRLSGAKSPFNPITVDSNTNKPFTIISNGHIEKDENKELYIENINRDDSSIYMTSDHTIPLEQSRDKYAGARNRPVNANTYKGKQIILNSGRLYFNSTEEDIQLNAQQSFGVTANQVYIDSENYIGLDSKKIYLGEQSRITESHPVIRGTALEVFLELLLGTLSSIGSSMTKAKAKGVDLIPTLNLTGPSVTESTRELRRQLDGLKSKKVFVE